MLTIVTPPTTRRLTTLARVKAELGISGSDQDTLLNARIDEVSDMIASTCRREFGRTEVLETLRPQCPVGDLLLARWPVVEVSAVVSNGIPLVEDEWVLDRAIGKLNRLPEDGDRFVAWASGLLTVQYSYGWLLPGQTDRDLPFDVEAAAVEQIKVMQTTGDRDPTLRSETVDGVGRFDYQIVTNDPAYGVLCAGAAARLRPYIMIRVG